MSVDWTKDMIVPVVVAVLVALPTGFFPSYVTTQIQLARVVEKQRHAKDRISDLEGRIETLGALGERLARIEQKLDDLGRRLNKAEERRNALR